MLGVGGLPPPPPPQAPPCANPGVSRAVIIGTKTFPLLSNQICKTYFCAFPLPSPASPLSVGRSGVYLFAQNKRKNGGTAVLDSRKGFEEEEDEDDDEFDFFEDGDEDEDEDVDGDDDLDVIVPIEELDEWLKRKPRGFGEGKVYDTSVEDKLVEELEQSRRAQLANVSKLESLSLETKEQLNKDAEAGVCVRISNLPKKRNIQRDLKTAFKGISGIVNITPSVLGNKKTKDPICKGFAFMNFRSLEDAKSQKITFGKIDKRIKCELMNRAYNASPKTVNNPNVEGKNKADSDERSDLLLLDKEDDSEESWDIDSGDEDDEEEDGREKFISLSASELDDIEQIEQRMMSSIGLLPSKRRENPQAAVKVEFARKESEKTVNNPNVEGKNKADSDDKSSLLLFDEEDDSEEPWDTDSDDEDDEEFDVTENFKSLNASKLDDIERIEQKMMSSVGLLSSKGGDNPQAAVKGKSARKKGEKKNAMAKIPGAPKSLNSREKAMPADSGDEVDEDIRESFKSLSASKDDADVRESLKSFEQKMMPSVVPLASKHVDKSQAVVKVKSTQRKREKKTVPKLPGAAKSLKLRDKAMLADVLSRYGSRVASASKES